MVAGARQQRRGHERRAPSAVRHSHVRTGEGGKRDTVPSLLVPLHYPRLPSCHPHRPRHRHRVSASPAPAEPGAMKPVGDHHHGLHSPTPATKMSIPFSSGEAPLLGKGRHKTWALAAIALLALWSMFAASVTLRWSSGDLPATFSDASDPVIDDLDPLEMEEREKLVRRMWDMYTRTGDHVRLPRFWQEAFEAAFEELAGDDMQASDAAVSEIARMSVHRPEVENS